MKKTILLLFVIISVCSCTTIEHICPCDFNAVETVDNCELKLDVSISINKMPTIGTSNTNKGALLVARVTSTNGQPIPSSIKITRYVVGFEERDGFVGEFTERRPSEDNSQIELIARDVKEFKEGMVANIAIELVNGEEKRSYLTKNEVSVMAVH